MNRNQLKYIAAAAMLMDHIGMKWFTGTDPAGFCLRLAGRLAAPVMLFFLAEGYRHTSSQNKYGLRLLIFGLISQVPYALFHHNTLLALDFNVILTLFLCFTVLLVRDNMHGDPRQIPVILVLIFISTWFDWGLIGPLFVLFFDMFRGNRKMQAKAYTVLTLISVAMDIVFMVTSHHPWYREIWQLGLFLFLPLLFLYNEKGGSRHPFHKWFFYAFYPMHLLILWIVWMI